MCKGKLEDKMTTFMVEIEKSVVIVKNVPSQVCRQCGEASYNDTVAREIEIIVDSLKKTISEISVVNYADKVA
jgi:YgiT-type zinc finger domain-containing protein